MESNMYEHYQKIVDDIEKTKQKKKAITDQLNAAKYKHSKQIDYKKDSALRKERTHRLVQKGALFEKYIEEHLKESNQQNLKPEDAEILLDVFSDILKKNKAFVINQFNAKKSEKNN